VLCRESAAAIWGIPRFGRWPGVVHLADVGRTRPRSRNGIAWHQDRLEASEVVEIQGVLVTDLTRTLVDLARVTPFLGAVVALDHGMRAQVALPTGGWVRGASRAHLTERLECGSPRGRVR
jgi:predicted transcriptional regulator of viral defense system